LEKYARFGYSYEVTQDEKKALQYAGTVFLALPAEALLKALQSGVLLEVFCEQDH
jgi:hypothetical protein